MPSSPARVELLCTRQNQAESDSLRSPETPTGVEPNISDDNDDDVDVDDDDDDDDDGGG